MSGLTAEERLNSVEVHLESADGRLASLEREVNYHINAPHGVRRTIASVLRKLLVWVSR